MRFRYLFLLLLLALYFWYYGDFGSAPTLGILAPDEPAQLPVPPGEQTPWTYHGDKIIPLARYSIRARLLSREPYWMDTCSQVSPLDFALGWGQMSDPTIYKKLNISQGMRWYTWHWWNEPSIPEEEIELHSSNNHLIPATDEINHELFEFRPGDVVWLTGYLVEVDGPNGWHWVSSLTRTDTGDGSCELIWVKYATKVGR